MKNYDLKTKDGQGWLYSDAVKEHFMNPKNYVKGDEPKENYNGVGMIGNPACGDVMKVWILVKKGKIKKCWWQTFGCAPAIATTSVMSVIVTNGGGMDIEEAKKLTAMDIVRELGGLPDRKIHCSVLGDQALRLAIEDYLSKNK